MSAKHKTAEVAPPAPEVKKPAPQTRELPEPEPQVGTETPTTMRKTLADPGRMSGADIRTAQRAYGNQFVQRLARGTTIRGVRASKSAGGQVSRKGGGKRLQRAGDGAAPVHSSVENRIESQRGAGQPLPEDTQEQMEGSFGADFSGVRVHTGGESNDLNRSLNARAFTTGQDLYFADNEYNPNSSGGQELIAHELTHVVQQGGAPAQSKTQAKRAQRAATDQEDEVDEDRVSPKRVAGAPLQRAMTVNAPGDEYEQEADSTAKQVMSKSAQRAATDKEDEETVATKPVQRDHLPEEEEVPGAMTQRVQRAEQPEAAEAPPGAPPVTDDKSAEAKSKVTEADQKQKQPPADKKPEEEKKPEQKDAQAQTKKQGAAVDEKEKKDQQGAQKAFDAQVGGAGAEGGKAGKLKSPEEMVATGQTKLEGVAEQSVQTGQQLSFEVNKPPEWDAEMAMHDLFAGVMSGESKPDEAIGSSLPPGIVQTKSGGFGFAPGVIMRDAASTTPATTPAAPAAEPPEKKDSSTWVGGEQFSSAEYGDHFKVPKHENALANMFVGDIGGKSVEVANSFASAFASDSVEATGWGRAAAFFEALVQVTEVLTNVLGMISLIMMIVAGIMYALGTLLTAFLFTAAAGAVLLAWASVLLAWTQVLGTISIIITEIRMVLRLLAIALRAIELTMIKDPEKLKRAKARLYDQALGMAMDVVAIGLEAATGGTVNPSKLGAKVGEDIAEAGAKRAASKVAAEAVEAGTSGAKSGVKTAERELAGKTAERATAAAEKKTAKKAAQEAADELDSAKNVLKSKKDVLKEAQDAEGALASDATDEAKQAANKRVKDAEQAVEDADLDVGVKNATKSQKDGELVTATTNKDTAKDAVEEAKTGAGGLGESKEALKNKNTEAMNAFKGEMWKETPNAQGVMEHTGFGTKGGEYTKGMILGGGVGFFGGAGVNTLKSATSDKVSQNDQYNNEYKPYYDRVDALLKMKQANPATTYLDDADIKTLNEMKTKLNQGQALTKDEKDKLGQYETKAQTPPPTELEAHKPEAMAKRRDASTPAETLIAREEDPYPVMASTPQPATPAPVRSVVSRSPAPVQGVVAREETGGGEPTILPPPPVEDMMVVDNTAQKIGGAEAEKGFLQIRLQEIDELLAQKGAWQTAMSAGRGQLKTQKVALQGSDQMDDQQIAHAETGMEHAKSMQGPAKEAQSKGSSANSGLSSMQGPMDQGAEKAKEKGQAAPDPSVTQGGAGKASEGGAQAGQLSNQAAADNQKSKNDALANKAQSKKVQDQTDSADKQVNATQNQNQSEIEILKADRQGVLNRLAEIDGQVSAIQGEHDAALGRTQAWTEEHKAAREAAGASA